MIYDGNVHLYYSIHTLLGHICTCVLTKQIIVNGSIKNPFVLCFSDGRALAVGGMGADLLPRSILQQYDLRKDVWALLPTMPTPRYDANTHLIGNKLYVVGTYPLAQSYWLNVYFIF